MRLPVVAFTIFSLLCLAESSPINGTADLRIIKQITTEGGASITTIYGGSGSPPATSKAIKARQGDDDDDEEHDCGQNALSCDNKNLAKKIPCRQLVDYLRGADEWLPDNTQAICKTYRGSSCCVAWSELVPFHTAKKKTLWDAAEKTLTKCRGANTVSGKTSLTLIGDTCLEQCLSSKPSC
ncbi:hypothetical protein ONZ43_g4509 [Nemania bipapillata]|uniref:Uncharacterized protein n=1 Tax=Nemania bipapillata TaxID=110536 RepID=A0ACC2ILQ1_9PEZI|nr:hypothetical protein ONZ43_g4509 [Nemania bipapillata]